MNIGEKIRARRLELGITAEELGNKIGVQKSAVIKYEKGRIDLKSKKIQAIAKALDISPVSLLPDVEQTEEEKLIDAYWRAEPIYREIAFNILSEHPLKKDIKIVNAAKYHGRLRKKDGNDRQGNI